MSDFGALVYKYKHILIILIAAIGLGLYIGAFGAGSAGNKPVASSLSRSQYISHGSAGVASNVR